MDASFTKRIREIPWAELTVTEAQDIMSALREAQAKGEEWFAGFAAAFGKPKPVKESSSAAAPAPRRGGARTRVPRVAPRAAVRPSGTPAGLGHEEDESFVPDEPHPPVTMGGGAVEEPRRVPLMPNSYLSKDGPQGTAELPPDHPRGKGMRGRAARDPDEAQAEAAIASGKGAQSLFN